jgi:hypothetical protein
MKAIAIALLVVSPVLLLVGMAGCVAAISSLGSSSQEMTGFEALAFLAAGPCFVTGLILLIVERRGKRRRHLTNRSPS